MKKILLLVSLFALFSSPLYGQVVRSYSLDPIDERYMSERDEDMERYLKRLNRKMSKQMNVVVGYSERELSNELPPKDELPQLLTRLLCEHAQPVSQKIDNRPVEIALLNYGGIRDLLPQGTLTLGDFYRILPFENLIVLFDITGAELLKMVAQAPDADFAAFHGVKISSDKQSVTVNGAPVNPQRTYRVVSIDFIESGGDNILKDIQFTPVVNTMQPLRDGILEEIEKITAKGEHIK